MEAQAPRANGRPRVNGRHASMDASRQWAPRVNGRHASMDASRQWAPRVNGRLASMDATRQWTPSRQWTPRLCKLIQIINIYFF